MLPQANGWVVRNASCLIGLAFTVFVVLVYAGLLYVARVRYLSEHTGGRQALSDYKQERH